MVLQLSAGSHPPLSLPLLQDACKIEALEHHQTPASGSPLLECAYKDGIGAAEYVKAVRKIVLPEAVEVLAVREVEECGSVELAVLPVGEVEGQVVVDEDAHALPQLSREAPLVFTISVVQQLHPLILKLSIFPRTALKSQQRRRSSH